MSVLQIQEPLSVLKPEIKIHISVNSIYTSGFCVLPSCVFIWKVWNICIVGKPQFIVSQSVHIKALCKHITACIDHRRVACCLYGLAEPHNTICPLIYRSIIALASSSPISSESITIGYVTFILPICLRTNFASSTPSSYVIACVKNTIRSALYT